MNTGSTTPECALRAAEAVEEGNRAGQIETRGIDFIPAPERHGRPFELFWVWMGANINYLSFAFGGLLIIIGLSVWEAVAVTLLGNLWWIAVGWLSISGPHPAPRASPSCGHSSEFAATGSSGPARDW